MVKKHPVFNKCGCIISVHVDLLYLQTEFWAMPFCFFSHLCQLMVAYCQLIQLNKMEVCLFQHCRLNVRTHAAEKREIEKVVWLRDPSGMLW